MANIRALLICVLISTFAISGCSNDKQIVKLHLVKNDEITLSKGRTLEVSLDSNPTTGYTWIVSAISNHHVLQGNNVSRYIAGERATKGLVGAGGSEIFSFKAILEGTAKLIFRYARSWESEVKPVEEYVLQITVVS